MQSLSFPVKKFELSSFYTFNRVIVRDNETVSTRIRYQT